MRAYLRVDIQKHYFIETPDNDNVILTNFWILYRTDKPTVSCVLTVIWTQVGGICYLDPGGRYLSS